MNVDETRTAAVSETAEVNVATVSQRGVLSRIFASPAVLTVSGPVVLIILWEVSVRYFAQGNVLLPPASAVFRTLWEITRDGTLIDNALASLGRVAGGFVCAAAVGIPVGLMMGYYRVIDWSLSGIVNGLRPIPVAAWVPLSIILMGIGEKPAVFLVFLGTVWPILLSTIQGVHTVPKHLVWVAQTMGATAPQIFARVILPAALPSILTGLRVGVGTAFTCVIVAELIAVRSGLGYLITEARMLVRSDLVIAGMIAIGVVGFLLDWVVSRTLGLALRWQEGLVAGT
jgi:NitT/TauT family transport system permease protein